MVLEGLQEDMDDGNIQCTNHPYKNNTAGGICAFCLQEKLGKLVTSSFPIAVFPSYSSSSSPSFRSDTGGNTCALPVRPNAPSASTNGNTSFNDNQAQNYNPRRTQVPIRQTQKKNDLGLSGGPGQGSVVYRRSKSITTPRRGGGGGDEYSPRRTRFWSFLYLSKHSGSRKIDKSGKEIYFSSVEKEGKKRADEFVVVDESESPNNGAFDRKVCRSRSIGCGSRSFSGLGDCTLRRVESQREGKSKVTPRHDCIKESVKCGGIFSGFMINSSSSSSSSSSYWVSSSSGEDNNNMNGKAASATHLVNGRNKSWGWALASPIRAFSKPPSVKREASSKNTTPNLNAIPSLLSVSS